MTAPPVHRSRPRRPWLALPLSFILALVAGLVESDAALAGRIAGGDATALRRLYDRLGGRVRAIVLRVLGRPAEADDVVQDTFVEVWRSAGARIGRALDALSREQRDPIELMYHRGLSQSEAAQQLGVAPGTLESRVRAGMARLAELLDDGAVGARS